MFEDKILQSEEERIRQAEEDAEYSTYLSILRKNHIKSLSQEKTPLEHLKKQNNNKESTKQIVASIGLWMSVLVWLSSLIAVVIIMIIFLV